MITLRSFQSEGLRALESHGHVLSSSPTGSGKSLVYELAVRNGNFRTALMTPLLALARQQQKRFQDLGIPVRLGTSGSPLPSEGPAVWIFNPESLTESFCRSLVEWGIEFLVVDECHCVWEWGLEFRPAFRKIFDLVRIARPRRSLWLSATIPAECGRDLADRFLAAQGGPLTRLGRFDLPENLNLRSLRVPWCHRPQAILDIVEGSGIVFCHTRKGAERISQLLKASGREPLTYHAGLCDEERRSLESILASGAPSIVVATSAFGMGMNFRQLRWCILAHAPPSFLFLAQAVGRAGRSTHAASAVCLWDHDDFRSLEWMFTGRPRVRAEAMKVWRALRDGVPLSEALQKEFDSTYNTSDTCLSAPAPRTGR